MRHPLVCRHQAHSVRVIQSRYCHVRDAVPAELGLLGAARR